MKYLLIGCGSRRDRLVALNGDKEWKGELVTLDINLDHKPDICWDLMTMPYPFKTDEFDEIHAYEVLEHTGQQGDWRFFFRQWTEFWRILKPGGYFIGTSPLWMNAWAWGDPGHTRTVQPENFVFLSQDQYAKQIGQTPMTDYRPWYWADFETIFVEPYEPGQTRIRSATSFAFVLQAIKPTRHPKTEDLFTRQ
jgi:SAM-dependent methyltransferase